MQGLSITTSDTALVSAAATYIRKGQTSCKNGTAAFHSCFPGRAIMVS